MRAEANANFSPCLGIDRPGGSRSQGLTKKMKKKLIATGAVIAATIVPSMAAATDVTSAISGVATDAGTGVTAGVTIGAVVFGARVVWGAIKSMAH